MDLPGDRPGDDDPFGDPANPMGAFLSQMNAMMNTQDPWEAASQVASGIANQGHSEPNLDPSDRMALENLARVAELQVTNHSGMAFHQPIHTEAMNRTQWAKKFLTDQRPLLEGLAGSLGQGLAAQLGQLDDMSPDELGEIPGLGSLPPAMLHQMVSMMGPMMLSMMAGSTAGHLAARAFGHYELPLPRPSGQPLTVVLSNVDSFANDWSLSRDDIRMWVSLSDVAHHLVLCQPNIRTTLTDLIGEYTRAFSTDPEEMERQSRELGLDEAFDEMGGDMAALQSLAGDPDRLLGVMQSDRQRAIMPRIHAVIAVVEGWVDHALDEIGSTLLAEYSMVTEALRRRRVEAGPQTRFVERLFGLELSQTTFDLGSTFVSGVVDRADTKALNTLWSTPEALPTPNELEAPGLWMARMDIESREMDLANEDLEIPDTFDFDE